MALLKCIRAFAVRGVGVGNVAMFVVRVLSKASEFDVLLLAVLSSMGHDFVRIRADVIAFKTMKV